LNASQNILRQGLPWQPVERPALVQKLSCTKLLSVKQEINRKVRGRKMRPFKLFISLINQ
jgi:hypothetical protein